MVPRPPAMAEDEEGEEDEEGGKGLHQILLLRRSASTRESLTYLPSPAKSQRGKKGKNEKPKRKKNEEEISALHY